MYKWLSFIYTLQLFRLVSAEQKQQQQKAHTHTKKNWTGGILIEKT